MLGPHLLNPPRILLAILGIAPISPLCHQSKCIRMLFLGCTERAVQLSPQLSQSLWKRLSCAADLIFAPTLSLADHRVDTLFGSDNLLVATHDQCLRLTLPSLS